MRTLRNEKNIYVPHFSPPSSKPLFALAFAHGGLTAWRSESKPLAPIPLIKIFLLFQLFKTFLEVINPLEDSATFNEHRVRVNAHPCSRLSNFYG